MKRNLFITTIILLLFSVPLSATIQWLTKTSCIAGRVYCSSAVGANINGDSCIYVIAGLNSSSSVTLTNYEYNPKADTTGGTPWATRATIPSPGRWDAAATNAPRISVERIYVAGGSDANIWGVTYYPYCDEYTPSANTWLSRANMSVAREGPCGATLNNLVYIIGGGDGTVGPRNTNERYTPSTDSWTSRAGMTYARVDAGAATGINGSGNPCIYVFGGADNVMGTIYSYVEEYQEDSWTTRTAMPTARSGLLSITYNDTLIYCIGGMIDAIAGIDTRAVEVYNTRQNSWTIETQLPTARDGMAGGYVKNVSPDEFSLVSPTNGSTVATITPTLNWERTYAPKIWVITGAEGNTIITKNNAADLDPNNSITYTLWYGLYSDFSSYTEVTGLTTNSYTTPALQYDTIYYWKVKAIGSEQWCNELNWWFRTPTETAVELVSFSAWLYYGDVKVIWRTESEKENVQWLIERAYEKPSDFVSIGTVEGQGTKPTPTDYSFTDKRVSKEGKYFYRIGSVNTEGEILWQEPVSVIFKKSSSKDLLTVYNDNHRIKVNYIVTKPTEVTIEIFDKTGRRVKKLYEGIRERGNYTLTWSGKEDNGKRASQGVYFCRMQAGEKTQTVKFVYMR